jgi:hypothetical protein
MHARIRGKRHNDGMGSFLPNRSIFDNYVNFCAAANLFFQEALEINVHFFSLFRWVRLNDNVLDTILLIEINKTAVVLV